MKTQENTSQERKTPKPKFDPPALQRLGSLRELTRMFNGMGMDGGVSMMSFP